MKTVTIDCAGVTKSMHPLPCPRRLDTETFKQLCEQADKLGFDVRFDRELFAELDSQGTHLVNHAFRHRPCLASWEGKEHSYNFAHNNGVNVRALVTLALTRERTTQVLCDFDEVAFEQLTIL